MVWDLKSLIWNLFVIWILELEFIKGCPRIAGHPLMILLVTTSVLEDNLAQPFDHKHNGDCTNHGAGKINQEK